MTAQELLKMVPQDLLLGLTAETKVDYQVKKLNGITMFHLILHSLLNEERSSLRVMEELFNSHKFQIVAQQNTTTRFTSIRDRIATIDPIFFARLFEGLFDLFNKYLKEENALVRYDSTMVAISSKLLERGMRVGSKTDKVQVKYTVGMKGSLPCSVKVFDSQYALNENNTIPEAIHIDPHSSNCIITFDRGVHGRNILNKMTAAGKKFVTRLCRNVRYKIVRELPLEYCEKNNLQLHKDMEVCLMTRSAWAEGTFRLISGTLLDTGEEIFFLTNITDLSAMDIADIYKQRWQIEPFFKLLKQHLNASHLIARKSNGIQVMIYMTLIAALLIIVYKKINSISSYKIAKMRFGLQIEVEVTKAIVILCGGDPLKAPHIFSDT